ncbi:hypothetical protein [Halorussus ruber]|uniref:hypothetical protein n=1 Tax=Halorussus ruber TaxID=1126238 RepID=UPI00109194A4|nr:hypothetical protein [Halorussus ruber]
MSEKNRFRDTRRGLLRAAGLTLAGYGATTLRDEADPTPEDPESATVNFETTAMSSLDHERSVGHGPSLQVRYPRGEHRGLGRVYEPGSPQTELYTRYWIRYEEGFEPSGLDGKWGGPKQPGFKYPGEYGTDNPPDGTNGWSSKPNVTPDGGLAQYTWDMDVEEGEYGHQFEVVSDFPFGEWVKVEQRVKLNTVASDGSANPDGVLQVWVGDELELEKRSLRFSTRPDEQGIHGWLIFYFGGEAPSPKDQIVNFDEYALTKGDDTDGELQTGAARWEGGGLSMF